MRPLTQIGVLLVAIWNCPLLVAGDRPDYETLFADSDVVVVGSFHETRSVPYDFSKDKTWSRLFDNPILGDDLKRILVARETEVDVQAVMKGRSLKQKRLKLAFFAVTEEAEFLDGTPYFLGSGVVPLASKPQTAEDMNKKPSERKPIPIERTYLFFIRKVGDSFEPTTGRSDLLSSLKELKALR